MGSATLKITNYKNTYAYVNGDITTNITKIDIARGILSIGKTHWNQYLINPRRNLLDFLHYWTGLEPFLEESPLLRFNSSFAALDTSDKSPKSYNIGMGVARIAAERILKIPYLQHVDTLLAKGQLTVTAGTNERGDMVGLDRNNNWHVIEAKGRSRSPTTADKKKAKDQAEKITAVNGIAPLTKNYCITHIDQISCDIYLNDPDDKPQQAMEIEVDENNFIKHYYDKIFGDLYTSKEDMTITFLDQGIDFSLFRIDEENKNFYIGLESGILGQLKQYNSNNSKEVFFLETRQFNFSDLNINNLSIGIDGILVFHDTSNLLDNNNRPTLLLDQKIKIAR